MRSVGRLQAGQAETSKGLYIAMKEEGSIRVSTFYRKAFNILVTMSDLHTFLGAFC